jgi:hypothetical protein
MSKGKNVVELRGRGRQTGRMVVLCEVGWIGGNRDAVKGLDAGLLLNGWGGEGGGNCAHKHTETRCNA